MRYNLVIFIFGALCATASVVRAAEQMDHAQMGHGAMESKVAEPAPMGHSKMNLDATVALPMLPVPPTSGKAREAGFDGTELMEATSADASLAVRCAQASRGLIVLDRATWAQCTGKPTTPDAPAAKAPEHQKH